MHWFVRPAYRLARANSVAMTADAITSGAAPKPPYARGMVRAVKPCSTSRFCQSSVFWSGRFRPPPSFGDLSPCVRTNSRISACNARCPSDRLRSIASSVSGAVTASAVGRPVTDVQGSRLHFGTERPMRSSGRQHVNDSRGDQVLGLRPVGSHVRRCGVPLQVVQAFPFLDHEERVRSELRLEAAHPFGIDGRTILDATGLGVHCRHVGTKRLQDGVPLPGLRGDDGNDMDHGLLLGWGSRLQRAAAYDATTGGGNEAMSYEAPYAGLKVVDLSQGVAGPYCAMLLAQYGANVIKVEPPGTGDWARNLGVVYGDQCAFSIPANLGKRAIALDLKQDDGRAILWRLIQGADVFLQGFRPGVIERLGFGYDAVSEREPRIIYLSVSGFGQMGPLAERPAMDPILQAYTGLTVENRGEDGIPHRTPIIAIDMSTALFAYTAVSTALYARRDETRGRHIEASLMQAAAGLRVVRLMQSYLEDGAIRPPGAPSGVYQVAA